MITMYNVFGHTGYVVWFTIINNTLSHLPIAVMSNQSTERDALLPGTGYSPDFGINESNDSHDLGSSGSAVPPSVAQSSRSASKKDRVWVVAMCVLIACLASLVNGLMLGFTSPTLDKLSNVTGAQHITNGSTKASLFGVCSSIILLIFMST